MSFSAKVLGSFVAVCGFPVKTSTSETGRVTHLAHDLGEPCKVLTKATVDKILTANPKLTVKTVSNVERSNSQCHKIKLSDMLLKLAERSEKQGFLTAGDVKEIAKVSTLAPAGGCKDYRGLMISLMKKGYFTEIRGAGSSDTDEMSFDVDELDALL